MIDQVVFFHLMVRAVILGPAPAASGAAAPGWLDDNGFVADLFRELFQRAILSPFVKGVCFKQIQKEIFL
jgi:hypothetical protein